MQRRAFLTLTGATLAAPLILRKAYAGDAEVTLKLHHFLGPKSPAQVNMLEPWSKRIEEDSKGRIKIEIYPSMSLGGSPPQLFRQCATGVVDIIWAVNGYTPGLFPHCEVFELPTVFTNDIAATNLAMRAMYKDYISKDYGAVHLLFNHVHAGQAIHMARKPVHSIKDTKGTRLRVPGPTGVDVVKAMGATPVSMPVPDLPQALSTNVVDGALIPWEIIPALQLQDVTKYQIEGPDMNRFGTTTFQVSMNKKRWEGMPKDLQEVFNKNCNDDWLREVAKIWRDDDNHGIEVAVKHGNEHIVLTQAEMDGFNKALAPVVDKWAGAHKSIDGAALVDTARKTIGKYA
ncbi:C4-dicarboxylate ABC transporter substrate-binding protein [Defluviimonas sp. 20V17]|uniref:C4-dicarboxylate ABC transporter n=1 Tax=Allgaiera indica TaxID=765699 RepID=A0AAN5A030_9RHOB|nr:TRAP transporter substrate-binding protein [Allgaiera indica]KDB01995.1 C4-dicarboxylate ABC transporter substrate-binding protein [Defluviimonas sp. 20V17]GHE03255.1 C4-dicarboxylate ABC transporter [Allgaiera indica]SDX22378.1 TRAP-type C4-dicarboxylate transport system, substrate-binding protein [Allgaiera indica]